MNIKTRIKKVIFKNYLVRVVKKLNERTLKKLYDLYDYVYLDNELKVISKELRERYVKNMIKTNKNDFIKNFGDFKTANLWINEPWTL